MNKTIILLLTAILFLASCGGDKKGKDTAEKDPKKALEKLKNEQKKIAAKIAELEASSGLKDSVRKIPVRLTSMFPDPFYQYLELQGRVDAGKSVNATPEAPGVVQRIHVRNGQYVRRGQTLATLKAETINNGIAELNQQISFAKTMYDKQKKLWAQDIGTEVQLLTAKNQYQSLLKKKQTTLSQRRMYVIKAPISGVVDDVNINVGDMANPGMPNQIRIVNTGAVKVKVDIPESYAGRVTSGSKAEVILPDFGDTMETRVRYVQKTIDPLKRTFTAEINPPSRGKLRPNMVTKVKIATYSNPRAFVLPAKVIQKINGGDYVYVKDNMDKAKLKRVILGKNYRGKVEIKSGLLLDDLVVTAGYEELNEGDKLSFKTIN
jgi:RND family efflux transporter MFP subunit